MASKVDRQAGAHIERLFHAPNCRVWERLDSTVPIHPGDIPIQCADGDVISVAHSAEVADEWDVSDIAAAFNRAAWQTNSPRCPRRRVGFRRAS